MIREGKCICRAEGDLHAEDCPKYEPNAETPTPIPTEMIQPSETPALTCTCDAIADEDGVIAHAEGCALYVAPECTCGALDGEEHAEGCALYVAPECTCGALDGEAHKKGCEFYVKACTCGAADGEEHAEECDFYVEPEFVMCTCGALDGEAHAQDCMMYEEPTATPSTEPTETPSAEPTETPSVEETQTPAPTDPACTCEAIADENGVIEHTEACALYTEPETDGESVCICEAIADENGVIAHAEDCALYVEPEKVCTCEALDGEEHAETCELYVEPEFTFCTCGALEGEAHEEGCALYVAPECTCEALDGEAHAEGCALYEMPQSDGEEQQQGIESVTVKISPEMAALGEELTFEAIIEGTLAEGATFQWQISPDGSVWYDIEGATEPVYTVTATMREFLNYHRVVVVEPEDEAKEEGETFSLLRVLRIMSALAETQTASAAVLPMLRSSGNEVYWNPNSAPTFSEIGLVIVAGGSDANDGTETAPVQSLTKAIEKSSDGTKTIVCMNVYELEESKGYSGPVTIEPYDNPTEETGASHTGYFFEVSNGIHLTLGEMTLQGADSRIALSNGFLTLDEGMKVDGPIFIEFPSKQAWPITVKAANGTSGSNGKFFVSFIPDTSEWVGLSEGDQTSRLALYGEELNAKWMIYFDGSNTYAIPRPAYKAIYLDGVNGDDNHFGNAPDCPVKTFAQAKKLLETQNVTTIYLMNTVTPEAGANYTLTGEQKVVRFGGETYGDKAYAAFNGVMFDVQAGNVTFNFPIDGNDVPNTQSAILVSGGSLVMGGSIANQTGVGVEQTAGALTLSGADISSTGAWGVQAKGGSMTMTDSTVSGNGGVYAGASLTSLTMTGGKAISVTGSNPAFALHYKNDALTSNTALVGANASGTALTMEAGTSLTYTGTANGSATLAQGAKLTTQSGASMGSVTANSATVDVQGGSVTTITANSASTATVSGGSVTMMNVSGSAATVSGGSVSTLNASGASTIALKNSGAVSKLTAGDTTAVTMTGGSVTSELNLNGTAKADITGGTIATMNANASSVSTIANATIATLNVASSVGVTMASGAITTANVTTASAQLILNGGTTTYINLNAERSAVTTSGAAQITQVTIAGNEAKIKLSSKVSQYDAIKLRMTCAEKKEGQIVVEGIDGYDARESFEKYTLLNSNDRYALGKDEPKGNIILVLGGVYVANWGSDGNNGLTKETPVRTLKQAVTVMEGQLKNPNALPYIIVVNTKDKADGAHDPEGYIVGADGADNALNTSDIDQTISVMLYTANSDDSLFTVENGAAFSIKKAKLDGSLGGETISTGTLVNVTSGSVSVEDGAKMQYAQNGIALATGTSATMNSATIENCATGVDVNGGTLTMNAGASINESTTGVDMDGGAFEMTGGTISGGNTGADIASGTFSMANGAAISGAKLGVNITGGTANIAGAVRTGEQGVQANGGTLTLTGTIESNNGSASGAGLYIGSGATVTLSSAQIKSNITTGDGGGVYMACGAAVTLTGATISGNRAKNGAGLYIAHNGTHKEVTLGSGMSITGNIASENGGGVYYACPNGSLTLESTQLTNNGATNGGAIYAELGTVAFNSANTTGSSATNGSALYLATNASFNHNSGTLTGTAYVQGSYTINAAESSVQVKGTIKLITGDSPVRLYGEAVALSKTERISISVGSDYLGKVIVQGNTDTPASLDNFTVIGIDATEELDEAGIQSIVGGASIHVYWDPQKLGGASISDDNNGSSPYKAVESWHAAKALLDQKTPASKIILVSTFTITSSTPEEDRIMDGRVSVEGGQDWNATIVRGMPYQGSVLTDYMFKVENTGTLELSNITISGERENGSITTEKGSIIYSTGSLNIADSVIKNGKLATQYDTYNNLKYFCGGGVNATGGTLMVSRTVFDNCQGYYGGGIYATGTPGKIDECEFKNCNAYWGGGVYVSSSRIASSTITDFYSKEYHKYSLEVVASSFHDNRAQQRGSAILMYPTAIIDCKIYNNTLTNSDTYGGAIHMYGGGLLDGCEIYGNKSSRTSALGIYNMTNSGGYALIEDCVIGRKNATAVQTNNATNTGANVTTNEGAAVYTWLGAYAKGRIGFRNTQITGNYSAGGAAAGLHHASEAYLMIDNCDINYNYNARSSTSSNAGALGILVEDASTPEFRGNTVIRGNECAKLPTAGAYFADGLAMTPGASLLIEDNIAGYNYSSRLSGMHIAGTGTYDLTGVTVRNHTNGGVSVSGSIEKIIGLTVTDNTKKSSSTAAGVYINSSTDITLEDCEITNNTNSYSGSSNYYYGGGGIYKYGTGSLILDNTLVQQNKMNGSGIGGGIYVYSACTIKLINGSHIVGNSASHYGGGIGFYHANNGEYKVEGDGTGIISGNTARYGAGVAIRYNGSSKPTGVCNLSVSDICIVENKASTYGGGIYAISPVSLILKNTTLENNTSSSNGGGIYTENTLDVTDSHIALNSSSSFGGGIYTSGKLTVNGSTISENTARNGGGVYSTNSASSMTGSTVTNNTATGNGGGIYASGMSLTNATIQENTAKGNGGGVYIAGGADSTIIGGSISGNTANLGGALYLGSSSSGATSIVSGTISGNTAPDNEKTSGIYNAGQALSMAGSRVKIDDNIYLDSNSYPITLTGTMRTGSLYKIALNMSNFGFGSVVVEPSEYITNAAQYLRYTSPLDTGNVFAKGEEGNRSIVLKRCIFVSDRGNDDKNSGTTPDHAYKTMKKALEEASNGNSVIYVSGEVTVRETSWSCGEAVDIRRYTGFAIGGAYACPAYKGDLFTIPSGTNLSVGEKITVISGRYTEEDTGGNATGSIFNVEAGGSLTFAAATELEGNNGAISRGGAIRNAGTVNVNAAVEIRDVSATSGGAIYNTGSFNVSGSGKLSVAGTRAQGSASLIYQAGEFTLENGATLDTDGTMYVTNGKHLTVESADVNYPMGKLSMDIGDPSVGRTYVQYRSAGDAQTQRERYQLPTRITSTYLLTDADANSALKLQLNLSNIVYVDPTYDGGEQTDKVKGLTADYPFKTLDEAYAYLTSPEVKQPGGLIYIVSPITIKNDETVSVGATSYTQGNTTTSLGSGSVAIKRYVQPSAKPEGFAAKTNEGALFIVEAGGSLTLNGVTLDGHSSAVSGDNPNTNAPGITANAPLVDVSGMLTLTGGALLDNNSNTNGAGAIKNSGTVNVYGEAHVNESVYLDTVDTEKFITVKTGTTSSADPMHILLDDAKNGRVIADYGTNTPTADELKKYVLEEDVLTRYKLAIDGNKVVLQSRAAAYISDNGSDSNSGTSPDAPIKTFEQAYTNLSDGGGTIYVVGTVTVTQEMMLSPTEYISGMTDKQIADGSVRIMRYAKPKNHPAFTENSFTGAMIAVDGGALLTLNGITVDGHSQEMTVGDASVQADGVEAKSPMIVVMDNSELLMENGAVLRSNNNTANANSIGSSLGGAARIAPGGTMTIVNGRITGNASSLGAGILDLGTLELIGRASFDEDQHVYLVDTVAGTSDTDRMITVREALSSRVPVDFADANHRDGENIAVYTSGAPQADMFDVRNGELLMKRSLAVSSEKDKVLLRAAYAITYPTSEKDYAHKTDGMPDMAGHEAELKTQIAPDEGYILPPEIEITMQDLSDPNGDGAPDQVKLTPDDYTYDPETGEIVIKEGVIKGPVTIDAQGLPKVTYEGNGTQKGDNAPDWVEKPGELVTTIVPQSGYVLPETVTVTITTPNPDEPEKPTVTTITLKNGDEPGEKGNQYTITTDEDGNQTGAIVVGKDQITGPVTVTANGEFPVTYPTADDGIVKGEVPGENEGETKPAPTQAKPGETFITDIDPTGNCKLPEEITIKVADPNDPTNPDKTTTLKQSMVDTDGDGKPDDGDYTYDPESGNIVVNGDAVTGPITIEATGVYNVTYNLGDADLTTEGAEPTVQAKANDQFTSELPKTVAKDEGLTFYAKGGPLLLPKEVKVTVGTAEPVTVTLTTTATEGAASYVIDTASGIATITLPAEKITDDVHFEVIGRKADIDVRGLENLGVFSEKDETAEDKKVTELTPYLTDTSKHQTVYLNTTLQGALRPDELASLTVTEPGGTPTAMHALTKEEYEKAIETEGTLPANKTENAYYYDKETGALTFFNVTGDVAISGEAIKSFQANYAVEFTAKAGAEDQTVLVDLLAATEEDRDEGSAAPVLKMLQGKTFKVRAIEQAAGQNISFTDCVSVEEVKRTAGYVFANDTFGLEATVNGGNDKTTMAVGETTPNIITFAADAAEAKLNLTFANANALTITDTTPREVTVELVEHVPGEGAAQPVKPSIIRLKVKIMREATQINATVPLAIVLKTNIDGGSIDMTGSSYAIHNASDMPLELISAQENWTHEKAAPLTELNENDPNPVDKYLITLDENCPEYVNGEPKDKDNPIPPKRIDADDGKEGGSDQYNPLKEIWVSALSFVTKANAGVHFASILYKVGVPAQ